MKSLKFNKRLILDYISCNDIDEYSIDELEADFDFMIAVLKYTRDENIYKLCDEKLKNDISFIYKLTNIFRQDMDFCIDVIHEYEDKQEDDLNKTEASIILYNLYNTRRDDRLINDFMLLDLFYKVKKTQYEETIDAEEDPEWKNNYGVGFWFVLNEFKERPIIKDFFARKMVEELYQDNDEFNMEAFLHSTFKTKEELQDYGIKKFLMDSIASCDDSLYGYLGQHTDLISNVESKARRLMRRWDSYKELSLMQILDLIDEYKEENDECEFNAYELAYYISKELKIKGLVELFYQDLGDIDIHEMDDKTYESLFVNCDLKKQKELLLLKKKIASSVKLPNNDLMMKLKRG